MNEQHYRPDIDGLRAVSVCLVLLFHFDGMIPGGYVGVDVFFVISGFLITSIIQRRLREGNFSLKEFWLRRVRRIVPASITCLLVVLCACCIVMTPEDLSQASQSALASAFGVGNIYFWRSGGYFAGPSDVQPFLHYWSLAVEEQFYVVYPFVLLILFRRRSNRLATGLVVLFVASLGLSIWGVVYKPSATFYLLPTRAWELLLGGLAAVLPIRLQSQRLHEMAAILGVSLIGVAATWFDSQTSFPGLTALVPTVGAALIIGASSGSRVTWLSRGLSFRPLVFVGLISYSVYLWHWPIVALLKYCLIPLKPSYVAWYMVLCLTLGAVSWKYIELPFRNQQTKSVFRSNRRAFGVLGFCFLLLVSLTGALLSSAGWPQRFARVEKHLVNATWTGSEYLHDGDVEDCPRIGMPDVPFDSFIVWGDSHAMMLGDAFDQAARRLGISGRIISMPGTPPIPNVWRSQGKAPPSGLSERVLQFLANSDASTVILVARWSAYVEGYSEPDLSFEEQGKDSADFLIGDGPDAEYTPVNARELLANRLELVVGRLVDAGKTVRIMEQVPEQSGPTAFPLLLTKHLGLNLELYPCSYAEHLSRQRDAQEVLRQCTNFGAAIVETHSQCFTNKADPILIMEGQACYRDNDHLSRFGSQCLLGRAIEDLLIEVERDSRGRDLEMIDLEF